MRITETAIRRPITTAMAALIVILFGAVAFQQIAVDLMPDITLPVVTVRTDYRNVSPVDIESLITQPIERAVARVPGVEQITSTSSHGRSQVRVHFVWGTELDEAVNEVRSRLDRLRDDLPPDAEPPVIFKYDVAAVPIMFLGISGTMGPVELRHFAEQTIQYRLERIGGVAAADVRGGRVREIHVDLFADRVRAFNLSTEDIVRALVAENQNLPAGDVYQGQHRITVRTLGEFQNLDEIRQTVVARRNGRAVYLRDVAAVEDSFQEIDYIVRIDGQPGIFLTVVKRPGANTVAVADRVKEELKKINEDYAGRGIFARAIFDSSNYIRRSILQVRRAAAYGAILAVVVLLIFLRNIRSTLVIATAIPISVISAFALIYFKGFTLNIMTFGGLALGVGLLVDNAIVVLENIFRHRERGEGREQAALVGTREVASAITSATLTTLVVFLPIIFVAGTAGVMFQQLAWVVLFALAASLLVALTVIPVLSSRYLRISRERRGAAAGSLQALTERYFEALDQGYQSLLRWALGNRTLVVVGVLAIFVLTLPLFPRIGQEFMPGTDEGEIRIHAEMEEGTRIEVMDEAFTRLESVVRQQVPEAESILNRFGNYLFSSARPHRGEIRVRLAPRSERARSSEEIAHSLRPHVRDIPGLTARPRATSQLWLLRRVGLGGDDRLEVRVLGHDLQRSREIAQQVKEVIETVPGVSDARVGQDEGSPEAVIFIDRLKAAALGVSAADIAQVVRTSLGGRRATILRERGDEFDILVRLQRKDRLDMASVLDLPVNTPSGRSIPIRSLVSSAPGKGPVEIERLNQERVVSVTGDTYGRDMESIVTAARERLKQISLPPEFKIEFGGDYEEKQKAFNALGWGLILAIVLVYMVMAAQFESLLAPLIIMFSVPFAAVGVILMLFLTGTTLNVNSFIGIIMLAGVVVNNAIVLVDYINLKMREEGLPVREAVVVGGRTRLRPILMTTLTTVLAMVPLALGMGEGGEVQAPLARVVIGGLSTSALITLVLIPVIYVTAMEWQTVGLREKASAGWRLANGRLFRK